MRNTGRKILYRKLWKHSRLGGLLDKLNLERAEVEAGWGYRPSGLAARGAAEGGNGRLLLMEDAFVRSMKPGGQTVYGLVADSRGIYYDAEGESNLVEALNQGERAGWMREGLDKAQGAKLIQRFCEVGASKYNWYPGDFAKPKKDYERGVMVVDQTRGDTAIGYGRVGAGDFDRMVDDALQENPGKPIYLRAHPDHRYRGKFSCFSERVFAEKRVIILPSDLSPKSCFEFCDEVYAATSLMGMEALLHGKIVKCYGWNFYAGWGLTIDRCTHPGQARRRKLSLEELFQKSYIEYSHYFDPDTNQSCSLERILDHIELQRKIAYENAGKWITTGWVPWKRHLAHGFLNSPGSDLVHAASFEVAKMEAGNHGKLLLWGSKESGNHQGKVIRVEDGFLRSAGLGATFHRPLSWVFDDLGIYFDPRQKSRLEQILQVTKFLETDLQDAGDLISFLGRNKLSKYNLGETDFEWSKDLAGGRKVVLVPGQVEADASIRYGSDLIKTNAELLKKVRQEEPTAFIIFKAHPDLVAGARHGQLLPLDAEGSADLVVSKGNVAEWLDRCDAVYTMTSTVGFEAIMRGKEVRTYGMPFYAGWGLSRDLQSCERRTRKLSLEELVCGALIMYPRYLNPNTGEFTSAMGVAALLATTGAVGERRAWYLRIVSGLKYWWVRSRR